MSAPDESAGTMTTSEAPGEREQVALTTAGFLRRALATLVDHMLFAPLAAIWVAPVWEQGTWDLGLRFAALGGLILAYSAVMFYRYAQTVGMMALGMRVLRADGSRLEGRAILVRTLAYWAPLLLVVWLRYWGMSLAAAVFNAAWWIGLFWVIVDGKHQGYHDKIAGTVVVFEGRRRR